MTSNPEPKKSRWRSTLEIVTSSAIIIASITVIWANLERDSSRAEGRPGAPKKATDSPLPNQLSLLGAPTKGSSAAKVAMLVLSDFQCPYCSTFARQILPAVEEEFVNTGKVLLAFRHLPIERIHKDARHAAAAAWCAAAQGKFWKMHDLLFGNPADLGPEATRKHGVALQLDLRKFEDCTEGEAQKAIDSDLAQARQLGASATPTVFVGTITTSDSVRVTQRLQGVGSVEALRAELNRALDLSSGR